MQQLLNDPHIAQKRLERMIDGYGNSEFSVEQVQTLRSLKNTTEEIQAAIIGA